MTNWRSRPGLVSGGAVLATAALVAWIGYLKLSAEPALDRQLPYLASAGMAVIVLSAVGTALLLGDLLRTDDLRVRELERAVTILAGAMAGSIEDPPRRAPALDPSPTPTRAPAQRPAAKKTAVKRPAAKKAAAKKAAAKKATARKATARKAAGRRRG